MREVRSGIKERGKPRHGTDIQTLTIILYFEEKGKWSAMPRLLKEHSFHVIAKANRPNGGPQTWTAESVIANDPIPYNLRKTSGSLIEELNRICENRLGGTIRGITKTLIYQAYL